MLYFDLDADWKKFRQLKLEAAKLKEALLDINLEPEQSKEISNRLNEITSEMQTMANAAAIAGVNFEKGFAMKLEAARMQIENTGKAMEDASKKMNTYTKTIANLKRQQAKYAKNSKEYKFLGTSMTMANENLEYEKQKYAEANDKRKQAIASLSALSLEYDIAKENARELGDTVQTESVTVQNALSGMKRMAAGLFSFGAAKNFVQQMVSVRSTFQDTESAMTVFLKDANRATAFVDELKKEAYFNMFEFSDLNQASTQMLSYGTSVDEVIPKLHQLSEIATGTHQPIELMVSLFNKAKAMGTIDSRSLQQWARAGLNVTDILENAGEKIDRTKITFEQLNKAIEISTQAGGQFNGLMSSQMQNISAISGQLRDNITNMFNELGKQNEGTIHDAIKTVSDLVANYESIVPVIEKLVVAFGTFKAVAYVGDIVDDITGKVGLLTDAYEKNSSKAELLAVRKQHLAKGSREYLEALQLEWEKTENKLDSALKAADQELQAANKVYEAKTKALELADEEVRKAETALKMAKATGDKRKEAVAQTELQAKVNARETISEEVNAAAKDRNAKATSKKKAEDEKATAAARRQEQQNYKTAASHKFLARATEGVKNALAKLKISLLSNPFTIAAMAISGLVAAAKALQDRYKEIHAGEERARTAMAKAAEAAEDEKIKLNDLKSALDNTEKGTERYTQKKKALVSFAAQYDRTLADEIEKTGLSAEKYNELADAIERTANARKAVEFVSSERKNITEGRDKMFSGLESTLYDEYVTKGKGDEVATRYAEMQKNIGILKDYYKKAVESGSTDNLVLRSDLNGTGSIAMNKLDRLYGEDVEGAWNAKKALEYLKENAGWKQMNELFKQAETEMVSRKSMATVMSATGTDYQKISEDILKAAQMTVGLNEGKLTNLSSTVSRLEETKGYEKKEKITEINNKLQDNITLLKAKASELEKNLGDAGAETEQGKAIAGYLAEVNGYIKQYQAVQDKARQQYEDATGETIEQALARTKKEYLDAKAEVEKIIREGGSVEKYNAAKQKEEDAKKAYNSLGGQTDEQKKEKVQKFNDELLKMQMATEKRRLALLKDSTQKQLQQIDLEYREKKAEYERQERELQKQLANGEITKGQYKKKKAEIDNQSQLAKDERDDAVMKANRNLIEGYNKFDKERREKDEKYYADKAALENIIADPNSTGEQKMAAEKAKQTLEDTYVDAYSEFDRKRREIDEKYFSDLAALQNIIDNKGGEFTDKQVETAKRAKVKVEETHAKETLDLRMEELKKNGNWQMVFDNLNNYGRDTLEKLRKELENVGQSIKENLNPADLKAFNEQKQKLDERLLEFDPMTAFKEARKKVDEKAAALKDAKAALDRAKGTDKETEATKEYIKAQDDLARAVENYNKAAAKTGELWDKLIAPAKKIASELENIGKSSDTLAGDIIATAGAVSQSTLDILENITKFSTQSIDAMQKGAEAMGDAVESSAQATSKAISTVEKASVILAIISAVLQIAQKIDEFVDKRKNEAKDKALDIQRLQGAVNEYRMAVLEAQQAEKNWFNNSGLENLSDSYERGQLALKNYYETAYALQDKYEDEEGGGFLKKAGNFGTKLGALVGDTVGEGLRKVGMDAVADVMEYVDLTQLTEKAYQAANGQDWGKGHDTMYNLGLNAQSGKVRAKDNLRVITQEKKDGFLGIGSKNEKTEDLQTWLKDNGFKGELFDENDMINLQQADMVLSNFGDKLTDQTKITIEQLKQAREEYDQYLEDLHSYVSDLFGGITDGMVEALFNWLETGEDVMDSFDKIAKETFKNVAKDMTKTMINKMVVGDYSEKITELYKKYNANEISEDELTKGIASESQQLRTNYENALPVMKEVLKGMSDTLCNFGDTMEQQSAVAGAYKTMSEDTANVLEARFTAVYESNLAIHGAITMSADKIADSIKQSTNIADEARNILANSYLEQVAIREATQVIRDYCKEMNNNIADVNKNTKRMAG